MSLSLRLSANIINKHLISTSKQCIRALSSSITPENVEKTSLYDFHVAKSGKIVNFAGYLLPVQYTNMGISASHLHTRKHASIFDVSHMLQTYLHGKDVIECFEQICTADITGLNDNSGTLTVFTNEAGGILDDLIVTKISSNLLYVVSNAARKEHDSGLIRATVQAFKNKGKDVHVEFLEPKDQSLIAVQGPEAVRALQTLSSEPFSRLFFMNTVSTTLAGITDCRVTRCGYTGEDGVEISVKADKAQHLVESLLDTKEYKVELAGLGARDSLRLEAGLCLYGSDIDEATTPIEAGLAWLVAKRRRNEANFPGAQKILSQLKQGPENRRVGIRMQSGPPARHGTEIYFEDNKIGHITSGCPSPSLGGNVAMGYVEEMYKKAGTVVKLNIRNKFYTAEISKMPFLSTNYYNVKK